MVAVKEEYIINSDNTVRYVLGKYNCRPLIVFGINPSVATAEKNDSTISIVERVAQIRGCDGYLMLNLYPLRATNIEKGFPKKYDQNVCELNYQYIKERVSKGDEIVAAWGTHICDRAYFIEALKQINDIVKQNGATWVCLSKTKHGHPHHPTRLAYDKMTFEKFDMDYYLINVLKANV